MITDRLPRIPQEKQAPGIVFDQVSLSLGGSPLYAGLSLTVAGGQCTCILGPSGCGKSTLLRMISGMEKQGLQGTIRMGDEKGNAGRIAWMSQNDLLLPWLSLLDNILLGAKLRGEESAALRSQARHLMAEAGLAGYEDALPMTLSGGMRQRGALLRTLMEKRPVLLMDEPFSALDALTRMKLQDLAADLTRQATVLLVTHDPMEALRMGHSVLVLSPRPAQVKVALRLSGSPPRRVDDPAIKEHLGYLLEQLMDEGSR